MMLDEDIKFDHLIEQILVPAYNAQKLPLYEAIANVIGQLACIVSGDGTISR